MMAWIPGVAAVDVASTQANCVEPDLSGLPWDVRVAYDPSTCVFAIVETFDTGMPTPTPTSYRIVYFMYGTSSFPTGGLCIVVDAGTSGLFYADLNDDCSSDPCAIAGHLTARVCSLDPCALFDGAEPVACDVLRELAWCITLRECDEIDP